MAARLVGCRSSSRHLIAARVLCAASVALPWPRWLVGRGAGLAGARRRRAASGMTLPAWAPGSGGVTVREGRRGGRLPWWARVTGVGVCLNLTPFHGCTWEGSVSSPALPLTSPLAGSVLHPKVPRAPRPRRACAAPECNPWCTIAPVPILLIATGALDAGRVGRSSTVPGGQGEADWPMGNGHAGFAACTPARQAPSGPG